MSLNNPVTAFLFALLLHFTSSAVSAENRDAGKPLWELGIAAIGLSIPQYIGDEERYTLPLAAPYFVYRGEFLRADRDGIRGILFDMQNLSLDLGFSFDLPVSNDNKAREGMPELHLTGQVGPRINWAFEMPDDAPQVSLHLPLRYTIDTHSNALGWVVEPSLRIEKRGFGRDNNYSLRLDLGVLFTSEKYNDYYYSVDPQFVTAERPAYDANSGLHNVFAKLIAGYQLREDLKLQSYLIVRSLSPGVIADSPLVKDELYLGVGIGFLWRFWQSQELVGSN